MDARAGNPRWQDEGDYLIFDLETTGLDPARERLRAFGGLAPSSGELWLLASSGSALDDEQRLLRDSIAIMTEAPELVGWNITEFDLPFIAARASGYGIDFPLVPVQDEPKVGKYGHPRFTLPDKPVRDIAYEHKQSAETAGVVWSLQPLARAWGWQPLISLTGADMPDATVAQVAVHCLDDLEAIAFVLRRESA